MRTLRSKIIIISIVIALLSLFSAGIISNAHVSHSFDEFLRNQREFFQRKMPMMPKAEGIITALKEPDNMALEDQFRGDIWRGIAFGGFLAILSGGLLGFYLSGRVTKPLSLLTKQARGMKKHDYVAKELVTGTDEIDELSTAFVELADELQRVEELRKDVISDLAHEIMTPLQSMLGKIEGIETGIYTAKDLSPIKKDIERMRVLIDEMREFSHARAKSKTLLSEKIVPQKVIEGILKEFSSEITRKKIVLKTDFKSNVVVMGDIVAVNKIFRNVIENAIRYTNNGSISISLNSDECTISDTGIGIASEDIKKVFERFYRVDKSRNNKTGGSGLGLSIVKEYTDQMGWDISLESKVDAGTSVKIRFA